VYRFLYTQRLPINSLRNLVVHSVCLSSHSVNLANALPRCEILFFSTLGISAYVWPSYSKQASHPVAHISFCSTLQGKSELTEVGGTTSLDNLALSYESVHSSSAGLGSRIQTLVLPWKMMGSWPGPSEYANVQTAWAPLSSNPARSLWNCWTPSD
jgi:hypothetical protein